MSSHDPIQLWKRYCRHLCHRPDIGLRLDVSRMHFDDAYLDQMRPRMESALQAMQSLEAGAKANIDEDRMVGHFWLRAPDLAPDDEIRAEIEKNVRAIKNFAQQVHSGSIAPQQGDGFYVVLVVGIGGSALGPQFVADALGTTNDPMIIRFVDNTDPDGIDRTLAELDENLAQTLTIVISKSGGTVETRNGMLEVAAAYHKAELDFARHAVAVTMEGSRLHKQAVDERWLHIFPMWDWVGGRTSELSAVGLLPAALQGIDIDEMLEGARLCDIATREPRIEHNPAAMMALMWYDAVKSRSKRNMIVLPYRDRLLLLSRYLQQLIMESLGKRFDRGGKEVCEGLTVLGNKGTTDQHALVQQLQEGTNDFFATLIGVSRDREGKSMPLGEEATAGDFLHGFLLGTRAALFEGGRESMTISADELNARTVGVLIALFERAVGLYAELININAYHQPGVEMGKKAAGGTIRLQKEVLGYLGQHRGEAQTVEQIAAAIGHADAAETVFHILEHAAANVDHGVSREAGDNPFAAKYRM